MSRTIFTLALALCFAVPGMTDPGVQVDQNVGFIDLATPTFGIGTSTATNIGLNLPGGCKGFILNIFGGEVVVGHQNDISTGPLYVGYKIASGSFFKWEGKDFGEPIHIYGKSTGATPATGTLCAW